MCGDPMTQAQRLLLVLAALVCFGQIGCVSSSRNQDFDARGLVLTIASAESSVSTCSVLLTERLVNVSSVSVLVELRAVRRELSPPIPPPGPGGTEPAFRDNEHYGCGWVRLLAPGESMVQECPFDVPGKRSVQAVWSLLLPRSGEGWHIVRSNILELQVPQCPDIPKTGSSAGERP